VFASATAAAAVSSSPKLKCATSSMGAKRGGGLARWPGL
jgi:hypothetical protein